MEVFLVNDVMILYRKCVAKFHMYVKRTYAKA